MEMLVDTWRRMSSDEMRDLQVAFANRTLALFQDHLRVGGDPEDEWPLLVDAGLAEEGAG